MEPVKVLWRNGMLQCAQGPPFQALALPVGKTPLPWGIVYETNSQKAARLGTAHRPSVRSASRYGAGLGSEWLKLKTAYRDETAGDK